MSISLTKTKSTKWWQARWACFTFCHHFCVKMRSDEDQSAINSVANFRRLSEASLFNFLSTFICAIIPSFLCTINRTFNHWVNSVIFISVSPNRWSLCRIFDMSIEVLASINWSKIHREIIAFCFSLTSLQRVGTTCSCFQWASRWSLFSLRCTISCSWLFLCLRPLLWSWFSYFFVKLIHDWLDKFLSFSSNLVLDWHGLPRGYCWLVGSRKRICLMYVFNSFWVFRCIYPCTLLAGRLTLCCTKFWFIDCSFKNLKLQVFSIYERIVLYHLLLSLLLRTEYNVVVVLHLPKARKDRNTNIAVTFNWIYREKVSHF